MHEGASVHMDVVPVVSGATDIIHQIVLSYGSEALAVLVSMVWCERGFVL